MEKINLGNILSRGLTCPGNILNITVIGGIVTSVASGAFLSLHDKGKYRKFAILPLLTILGLYEIKHHFTPPSPNQLTYLTFLDAKTEKRWKGVKIPAATLADLYVRGLIDFKMDVLEAVEHMDEFCCYMPSWTAMKFLLMQVSFWV